MARLNQHRTDGTYYTTTYEGGIVTRQIHPDGVSWLKQNGYHIGAEINGHALSTLRTRNWLFTKEETHAWGEVDWAPDWNCLGSSGKNSYLEWLEKQKARRRAAALEKKQAVDMQQAATVHAKQVPTFAAADFTPKSPPTPRKKPSPPRPKTTTKREEPSQVSARVETQTESQDSHDIQTLPIYEEATNHDQVLNALPNPLIASVPPTLESTNETSSVSTSGRQSSNWKGLVLGLVALTLILILIVILW